MSIVVFTRTSDEIRPVIPTFVDAVEFFLEDEGDGESLRDLKLRKLCFLNTILK